MSILPFWWFLEPYFFPSFSFRLKTSYSGVTVWSETINKVLNGCRKSYKKTKNVYLITKKIKQQQQQQQKIKNNEDVNTQRNGYI